MSVLQDPTAQPSSDTQAQQPAATQEQAGGQDLSRLIALERDVREGKYIALDRYQGLQGTLQKEQNSKAQALTEAQNYRVQAETLAAEKSRLESQLQELTGFKTETEPKVQTLSVENLRLKTIVTQFPGLAKFEAEGLLPSGSTEEELVTKFTAFQTRVSELTKQAVSQFQTGASPETPGLTASTTTNQAPNDDAVLQTLSREKFAAAYRGDMKEFDRLTAQIEEIKAKKKA